MSLNDEDLYGKHNKLTKMRTEIYESIYKNCISRIKRVANTGVLFMFFTVPKVNTLHGFFLVDVNFAAEYIMTKLVKANKNIKTLFVKPDMILISWDPEHIIFNAIVSNDLSNNNNHK